MKNLIVFITMIALLAVACKQNKESGAQLDELIAKISLETQNKAIAEKIIDGLNQRDTSYIELYAPDCKYYFPSANPNPTTREDDINATKTNWHTAPNIHWKIEEMIAEGNMVAARFTVTGTPKKNGLVSRPLVRSLNQGGFSYYELKTEKLLNRGKIMIF